ncbi:MAG: VWA domain-containing protein [Candidatus Acidiferrum sp.]
MRPVYLLNAFLAFLLVVCAARLVAFPAEQASPVVLAPSTATVDASAPGTLRFLAVNHDGSPITDLRPEEVSVRIDGQPRKIVSLSRANRAPLTIGLFFDFSGSRRSDRLIPNEVQSSASFLESIWQRDDVGFVIAFGEIPVTLAKPTNDLQVIESALRKIPGATYRGPTALYDALSSVRITGPKAGRGEKLFITVGDFEDNSSHKSADETIEALRDEGIRVFPLLRMENDVYSSRSRHHAKELAKKFAENTGGDILVVSHQKDLDSAFHRITSELRSAYRLTYEPLPKQGELRKVQIMTSRPKVELFFPRD